MVFYEINKNDKNIYKYKFTSNKLFHNFYNELEVQET